MGLMEDYHPLKGKMFQILKSDGTLQPGEKPPLSDQETLTLNLSCLEERWHTNLSFRILEKD